MESGPILPPTSRALANRQTRPPNATTAYLEFLELTDFKSYAGHHVLGPLKRGLNCIVGSNGSGKSNLMDAICFVLGVETKFLRGLKLHDLGYRREGGAGGRAGAVRSAEVTMKLRVLKRGADTGSDDLVGSQLVSFGRKAVDGKSSQFLHDNKPVDRGTFLKALAQYNILPRVQNCIVSQGQVEAWSLNTDKEKTQMFDEVSGSAQFKEKYEALQKEIGQIRVAQARVNQEATTLQREYKALKQQWDELKAWQAQEEAVKQARIDLYMFKLYVNEAAGNRLRGRRGFLEAEVSRLEEKEKGLTVKHREQDQEKRALLEQQAELEKQMEEAGGKESEQAQVVEDIQAQLQTLKQSIELEEEAKQNKAKEMDLLYEQYTEIGAQWHDILAEQEQLKRQYKDARAANSFTKLPEAEKAEYLREKEKVELKTAELRRQHAQFVSETEAAESEIQSLGAQAAQAEGEMVKVQLTHSQHDEYLRHLLQEIQESGVKKTKLEQTFDLLTQQRADLRTQKEALTTELDKHQQIVQSFSHFRSEDTKAARFRQMLDKLKMEIPGVIDCVSALCEISSQKYGTAVSTALGLQANSVVVDTFQTAKRAIDLCKRMQFPPIEFLPLDSLKSRPTNPKLRNHTDLFVPLVDVCSFESQFAKVFEMILDDTVCVDDLDEARRVAFQECRRLGLSLKIVTLDGQTILKNCNIKLQGNRSNQIDRFAQKGRDTAMEQCERIKRELEPIETELRRVDQLCQHTESELARTKIDLSSLEDKLKSRSTQVKLYETLLANSKEEATRLRALVNDKEALATSLATQADALQAEIVKIGDKFLKTDELRAIHKAESELIEVRRNFERARVKIKDRENQMLMEMSGILRKLGGDPADASMVDITQMIEEALNNPQAALDEHDKIIEGLQQKAAKLDKQEADEIVKLNMLRQVIVDFQNSMRSKKEALENLKLTMHEISVDRKRTYHKLTSHGTEMQSLSTELELLDSAGVELIQEVIDRNIEVPVKGGSFQDFCQVFADPDVMSDEPIELDFSQITDEVKTLEGKDEILEAQAQLEKQYTRLKEALQAQGSQNHKAEEAFEEVKSKLRAANQTKEGLKRDLDRKENELQKTSDVRKDKFLGCFHHTQLALREIYAILTEPPKTDFSSEGSAAPIFAKHFSESVGGSATLELEDVTAEEPFNHGIIFSAMPYGKRYTEMELLSGGEKSMATLALLFSLQSYRQSPFVVLDEVDAALDAANVDALRRFLQRAKFQVIIVTLKEEMYCHADAIIGVYKDQVAESSATVTLDVEAYPRTLPAPTPPGLLCPPSF